MADADITRLFDGRKIDELPRTQAEAKSLGIKHYFTTTPCKNGHIDARLSGSGDCMACSRKNALKWRRSNLSEARMRAEVWRKDNLGRRAESLRAWRQNNNDKSRRYSRAYYAEHLSENREYARDWARANPEKRRVHHRNRRAKKQNAEGSHSAQDIVHIRKAQKGRCAYCGLKIRGNGHVDHIIALSRGGSNWPKNLQILCAPCNLSKHDRDPIEFLQSIGWLI